MWESIKKDPLLKTIIVAIMGVLAFGFAFNIMFGTGNGSMENDSMMGSGYSLSNTLEATIVILIKLVVIAILIGIILWIVQAIRKQIGSHKEVKDSILLNDGVIRNTLLFAGLIVIAIFLMWVGKSTFFYGYGTNIMNRSFYPVFSIVSILTFLLKLFVLALIVIFGFGTIMYAKEVIIKNSHSLHETPNKGEDVKSSCPKCNSSINKAWTYCPNCGNDISLREENASGKEE